MYASPAKILAEFEFGHKAMYLLKGLYSYKRLRSLGQELEERLSRFRLS